MTDALYERRLAQLALEAELLPREISVTNLAAIRRMRGLTQTALAEMVRSTQTEISRFERRRDYKLGQLLGYIGALGGQPAPWVFEFPAGPDVHLLV